MKKVLRYLLTALMAAFFCLPGANAAQAATVALLPLVNNVQGDDLANQVFYKEAMYALKTQKGFVLVENDQLTKAVEAYTAPGKTPTEAALKAVAEKGGVDIVLCLVLNELDKTIIPSSEERTMVLNLQGATLAYNKITGKFYSHRINARNKAPEAVSSRFDWLHEQWGRQVRREVARAVAAK